MNRTGLFLRQWRHGAVILFALTASACASARPQRISPGYGVTPQLLRELNCSQDEYDKAVQSYRAQMKETSTGFAVVIPKVGQSHCEVLAMVGVPDRTTLLEMAGLPGRQLQLMYSNYDKVHMITVQLQEGRPSRVVSVIW